MYDTTTDKTVFTTAELALLLGGSVAVLAGAFLPQVTAPLVGGVSMISKGGWNLVDAFLIIGGVAAILFSALAGRLPKWLPPVVAGLAIFEGVWTVSVYPGLIETCKAKAGALGEVCETIQIGSGVGALFIGALALIIFSVQRSKAAQS